MSISTNHICNFTFFSAIEGQEAPDSKRDPKARPRPLYDIPYMFEAREFLRTKLLEKKVWNKMENLLVISFHQCYYLNLPENTN